MIIIIDNYDSFTYNLYQYFGTLNPDIEVYRNDKITIDEILQKKPSHIVLSPGPGYPADAGICTEIIKNSGDIPILGICLGHQAVGAAFGGKIIHAPQIMHGKTDIVDINKECALFCGMDSKIEIGRYHSLVIDSVDLPECLQVTATSADGCIMGVSHKSRPIYGIQFHPESILTPEGMTIIKNFLKL